MVWPGCIAPPKSHFRPHTDQLRDRTTAGHHPTPTERDCEWARPRRARTLAFHDLTAGRKEQRLSNRESEPRASKPARSERKR